MRQTGAGLASAAQVATPGARSRTWMLILAGICLSALLSIGKGQDVNWDLLNYHRYVAYAFFNDRLAIDLAPAGMQSYFNPTLDLPIHWLTERLPGWQVGGLIGAWHGLVFAFIYLIVRDVWPRGRFGLQLLVAGAGVLAPVFWGGLGNSMGDNAAAVFALAAVWAAVKALRAVDSPGSSALGWVLATGFLLGAGTALKLSNAPIAVALAVALLIGARWPMLCGQMFLCLMLAGVAGFALGGGWWFHRVWLEFGNPFFPQFGNLFPSAWADGGSIADRRFIPEGLPAFILRPVLMLFRHEITSEFFVLPLLWPIWFFALVFAGWRFARPSVPAAALGPAWNRSQHLIVWYVLLAVLLWEALFGIYRYTAAIEPLLPLCVTLLVERAGGLPRFEPWLKRLFVLSIASTLLGGSVNWGHAAWAERSYRLESALPVEGDQPFVLMVGNGQSWLIPFFAPQATFSSVGGNFDFGSRYDAEIKRRAAAADRVYAVIGMARNWRHDVVDRSNAVMAFFGLRQTETTCDWLAAVIRRTRPHAGFERCDGVACALSCRLTRLDADRLDVARKDQEALDGARSTLLGHGLRLDEARCLAKGAFIGERRYPFRLCELSPASP